MQKGNLSEKVKKNLLDLQYTKYLQYYNTSIIILFTYVIGVAIAFITKQIDYKSLNQLYLVGLISLITISIVISLMLNFKKHLSNIPHELKKINL